MNDSRSVYVRPAPLRTTWPTSTSERPFTSTGVDCATTALALGLNNLTGSPWPSIVLKSLTKAVGDPRVALMEMQPGSATLNKLGESPDPGIPYEM